MNIKRAIGLILILISGILSWGNFIFTGAIIGASSNASIIVVLLFIIGLILLLAESRSPEGGLPGIIKTKKFERSIRGHDLRRIQSAIDKIGTKEGHEEKLRHMPGYTIRVDKNGRIMYHRDGETIVLDDYETHWHDRY